MVEGVASLGEWEMLGRLALAALLAGLLGLEREYDGQDAGFRTHLLMSLGAALFGLLSVAAFDEYLAARNDTNITVDVTRIAAYVAPGIGFIGGGTILKYGGRVTGITTATSLWTAAAIGLAAGLGAYLASLATTALALFALEGLLPISHGVSRLSRRRRSDVQIELEPAADVAAVLSILGDPDRVSVRLLQFGVGPDDEGYVSLDLLATPSEDDLTALLSRLSAVEGVRRVHRS